MSIDAIVRAAAPDGSVELDVIDRSNCDGCAGICMWRRAPQLNRARFPGAHELRPGDAVTVSVPAAHLLLSAVLVHGLPLASLLLGALLGTMVTQSDAGCLAGAVAGVTAMAVVTPRLRRRVEKRILDHVRLEPLT